MCPALRIFIFTNAAMNLLSFFFPVACFSCPLQKYLFSFATFLDRCSTSADKRYRPFPSEQHCTHLHPSPRAQPGTWEPFFVARLGFPRVPSCYSRKGCSKGNPFGLPEGTLALYSETDESFSNSSISSNSMLHLLGDGCHGKLTSALLFPVTLLHPLHLCWIFSFPSHLCALHVT